jgi:ABC-2 type transport system permease protein
MYPLDIFDDWLRRAVTFAIPLAFVDYYPALFLLGRPDPLGLPSWVGLLSPVAVALLAVVAWAAWSAGVRHYTSVGH